MRPAHGDDDTLIRASLRGDDHAFATLVRRHRPWVLRLLRAYADPETAEDLAQEVFTRLYRHAAGYAGHGVFVGYLKRIAHNVGRTHLQRAAAAPRAAWDGREPIAPGASPLDDLLARSLLERVRAAADALPDEQRRALALRYFAGMTVPEIAAHLGCAEGTVKSRLFTAVRKVRAALERSEDPLP